MAMPKCPKERRIRSWPQQLAPPVVLRSLGFWCSATTAATSSMGRTLATAFFSFLSTNAQGDAATDQRHTALTRGTHHPHSTHKVSAIRPETSSKKQWSDKEIVLVAMVGQANHCIQQHVALAQLPLGAHRGVPDDGAFYQERGQGFKVVVLRRRSPPQI